MTSKEALEQIKHCGNRDWRLAIEEVEKDLEKLDYIKILLVNYNNGELGYINFTQEVIEVLTNDKNNL